MDTSRREWLKRATALAAAGIAGDQLDLLDRLFGRRKLFPGVSFKLTTYSLGFFISQEMLNDDSMYHTVSIASRLAWSTHIDNQIYGTNDHPL